LAKQEILILVDDNDNQIGTDTRENCHAGKGKRHRAYTAFIFHKGKMLLQQRSSKKLLWPGAWDVSFTSHVYPGETYQQAASRRALEELGAKVGPYPTSTPSSTSRPKGLTQRTSSAASLWATSTGISPPTAMR